MYPCYNKMRGFCNFLGSSKNNELDKLTTRWTNKYAFTRQTEMYFPMLGINNDEMKSIDTSEGFCRTNYWYLTLT